MSRSWTPATVLAAAAACVAIAGMLTAVYIVRSLVEAPGRALEAGREVVGDLEDLAAAFREGTVTTRFINHAARISGGNKLVVAELRQTEIYTRTETTSVLWGSLRLPDVVVEVRVPVEYVYFLDLAGVWDFELGEHTLEVRAPPLRFTSPALDVSRMEYDIRESSLLRDEDAAIEALRSGLTELSTQRAREQISIVRETARRHTEEFVRNWLGGLFGDAEIYRIEVAFADETLPSEGAVVVLPEPRP